MFEKKDDDEVKWDMRSFKLDLGEDCYVERSNESEDITIKKYEDGKPTRKCVLFPLRRWKELEGIVDKIGSALEEVKAGKDVSFEWHLGGNVYVTVCKKFPTVDIRHFWNPKGDGKVVATRKGVSLRYSQYRQLKAAIELLSVSVPELSEIEPCYMKNDHLNQMGYLLCEECNPNGYGIW
ncbi:hypothetical protein BOV97_13070 [Solemya velum gill symbiont]|uniref:transcriptional coactivator p15/PC4 family protein n=1 Tax=Solemya velum gill symbiont TaxID=2340 RepID=UPI0009987011|nr:transcriptional coactivator p15/PC4 family protein [Solemya velum gill symbiont]OOY49157.1 hypothetical protein BOV97_13070 [Solemya velum gill symbiont]OOZ21245.1 hypothetical protein BOW31_12900 [Solemya velum gill symbiont]